MQPPTEVHASKRNRSSQCKKLQQDESLQLPSIEPDILALCHDVPLEVVQLKIGVLAPLFFFALALKVSVTFVEMEFGNFLRSPLHTCMLTFIRHG